MIQYSMVDADYTVVANAVVTQSIFSTEFDARLQEWHLRAFIF